MATWGSPERSTAPDMSEARMMTMPDQGEEGGEALVGHGGNMARDWRPGASRGHGRFYEQPGSVDLDRPVARAASSVLK